MKLRSPPLSTVWTISRQANNGKRCEDCQLMLQPFRFTNHGSIVSSVQCDGDEVSLVVTTQTRKRFHSGFMFVPLMLDFHEPGHVC